MANTTHFSTKDRILGAAEELFALHGFAGTSLRQVTSRADVNLSLIHICQALLGGLAVRHGIRRRGFLESHALGGWFDKGKA